MLSVEGYEGRAMPRRHRRSGRLSGVGAGRLSGLTADWVLIDESRLTGAQAEVSISQGEMSTCVDAGFLPDSNELLTDGNNDLLTDGSEYESEACTTGPDVGETVSEVTHYQCVGEGQYRVFYVWVRGQHDWVMPYLVVLPGQLGRLLDEREIGEGEVGLRGSDEPESIVELIWAYNVDRMKHEWVRWSDAVARPRYLESVRIRMPDAEGLWM